MNTFILIAGVYVGYKILRHIIDSNEENHKPGSSSSDSNEENHKPGSSSSEPPQSSHAPLSSSAKTSTSLPKPPPSLSSSSPSLSSTKAPPLSSNLSQKSSPATGKSSSKQSSLSPKPATSNFSQSFYESPSYSCSQSSSSSGPLLSSTKSPPSSSNLSQKSSPTPVTSSSKQSSLSPKPATTNFSQSFYESPSSSSSQSPSSSPKATTSSSKPSPYSSGPNPLPSFKTTLSLAFSELDDQQKIWLEKGTSPIYKIPKDIEDLIKKDIVPGVLKMPLSPSTYKDYFAALLYAEDFYREKWSDFKLENVTLELQRGRIYKSDEKDDKIFVAFEIENVPERRPFLLSRDFVFARPSFTKVEPFQGIIYCVEKSTRVLVEFADDFHSRHYLTCKYDVSFSFNRVCLKRAHQAIAAASDSIFRNFIFPNNLSRKSIPTTPHLLSCYHKLDRDQKSVVFRILTFQGPPPYLIQGPLCVKQAVSYSKELSRTGLVVREAVLQICRRSPESRILICAPLNKTCDVLMESLKQEIPDSDMFRANAAFREIDGVPIDILPSCPYKGECFVCPPLQELLKFRVILSTFISSFRLHKEGIAAGYFTYMFLVDTSSATEPEAMVALSNFADEKTAVVVTGAPRNHSGLVRSDIARRYGLKTSYFERLCESNPYRNLDPLFITQLSDF